MSEQEHNVAAQQAEDVVVDENHLIAERRNKLKQIRDKGQAYPNDFVPNTLQRIYTLNTVNWIKKLSTHKKTHKNCWPHDVKACHG